MEEREFKKQEYKIELKLVALLSVNDVSELKKEIPKLIEKRIESYNYPYLIQKKDIMSSINMQGYIKCKISEYKGITDEEKEFMNNDIANIRILHRNGKWDIEFTEEQSNKILGIYNKMEDEIKDTFNNSVFFK